MKTLTYNLKIREIASELSSRSAGASAKNKLMDLLDTWDEVEVDVDFNSLTPSFADECIGRLAASIGLNEFKRRVRVIHADESDKPLIRHVILRRCSENIVA